LTNKPKAKEMSGLVILILKF